MYQDKKEQLQKLQLEMEKRLDCLNKDLSRGYSSDSEEQALERENDEVTENLRDETEQELKQISEALSRIEKGEYGICESCGNTINPKRLEVLPYSTLCINCAETAA